MRTILENNSASLLVLEDGSVFRGQAIGSQSPVLGEVVFNTSMTGYQEMLTDPSYSGQIVVPTYPLIGNYGINERDFESKRVQVAGFVVRGHCDRPSHARSTSSLDDFLRQQDVAAISGVDTRAIARRLRTRGVMMGMITIGLSPEEAVSKILEYPSYGNTDFVSRVTTESQYSWEEPLYGTETPEATRRIVVDDCGLKYNILRSLRSLGCEVLVVPAGTSPEEIFALCPDGVVLSPGPGDPDLLDYTVETAIGLIGKIPILGICLGNQVLARAFGGTNYKLKFGHRGGNHPVRDTASGLVYITAQNHGYAVDPDSLPSDVEISHVNLNDGTVEGLRHKSLPAMSIQYHSEASPGPRDNEYIFSEFLSLIEG